jgi:hypothetical protein
MDHNMDHDCGLEDLYDTLSKIKVLKNYNDIEDMMNHVSKTEKKTIFKTQFNSIDQLKDITVDEIEFINNIINDIDINCTEYIKYKKFYTDKEDIFFFLSDIKQLSKIDYLFKKEATKHFDKCKIKYKIVDEDSILVNESEFEGTALTYQSLMKKKFLIKEIIKEIEN